MIRIQRREIFPRRDQSGGGLTASQLLAMRGGRQAAQNPGGHLHNDAGQCSTGRCARPARQNPGPWLGSDVPPAYYTDYGLARPSSGPQSQPGVALEGPKEAREVTSYTLAGPVRVNQLAATVSAQGCCYPPPTPKDVCEVEECLPELFADCFGQNVMYFNPLSHQMFILDKSQQGCVFVPADAGCCPDVLSPVQAVGNPIGTLTGGAKYFFVADFGNGTVGQWNSADKSFVDLEFPIGLFSAFHHVFVGGSPTVPLIIVQKACSKEMLRDLQTTLFCGGFQS
jgi:hypothetical protein